MKPLRDKIGYQVWDLAYKEVVDQVFDQNYQIWCQVRDLTTPQDWYHVRDQIKKELMVNII